jgi:hypothetical protein
MGIYRLTGNDTITLAGKSFASRLFTDLPHGEVAKLTYGADIATVKTGKNGNVLIAKNETGNQGTLELKVLRGSPDDTHLNSDLTAYNTDTASYICISGSVAKQLGDGAGKTITDTIAFTGGVITKRVEMVINVEGDVEQAVALYTIQFAAASRSIA